MATRIRYAEIVDRGVRIGFGSDERVIELPSRWLRDHGDDSSSVNPNTLQRKVDTFAIPADVEPLELAFGDGRLSLSWSDGATTTHDAAALADLIEDRRRPSPARPDRSISIAPDLDLWVGETGPSTPMDAEALAEPEGVAEMLNALHRSGWVLIDGVPPGEAAVHQLVAHIGYVRRTIFGDVWEMAPGLEDHQDSAYDTTDMEVHTDCTYSHDAPGVMLFACQEKTGEGGESVLVDGFAAARDMASSAPALADTLTRFAVAGRYIEPGVSLLAERPPLRLDPTDRLVQVSFNNYDRSPRLPVDIWVDTVIDAYSSFHELITDPARQIRLGWKPGRVLIFDNWRLLHGRTAFTGGRRFLGCYLNHEDLESRLRVAGLVGV